MIYIHAFFVRNILTVLLLSQLIDKSRDYFWLHDLEKHTTGGGILNVHVGDVFSPEAAISGGYAGKIYVLFQERDRYRIKYVHPYLSVTAVISNWL